MLNSVSKLIATILRGLCVCVVRVCVCVWELSLSKFQCSMLESQTWHALCSIMARGGRRRGQKGWGVTILSLELETITQPESMQHTW